MTKDEMYIYVDFGHSLADNNNYCIKVFYVCVCQLAHSYNQIHSFISHDNYIMYQCICVLTLFSLLKSAHIKVI